jgi:cyclopropane-fatty-acyl-phospholipid synthase
MKGATAADRRSEHHISGAKHGTRTALAGLPASDRRNTTVGAEPYPAPEPRGLGARLLNWLLRKVGHGSLTLILPSGARIERRGPEEGPEATIVILRWRMLSRTLTGGDIGFAEAYLRGEWTSPDLTAVIRFAARNNAALERAIQGNVLMRTVHRLGHIVNANTRHGSRRNIEAHYDLGNDFYRRWLDPSMLYSSAIFSDATQTLEAGQRQKLDAITAMLRLSPGESVLEIGCGWGALALHLAECGGRVTGITLSPSQLSWADHLVADRGMGDHIDLKLQDYRDVVGQFDHIVSIEMFEAVGEAYWAQYFQTLKRCLKREGTAVLQVITIEEQRYAAYRNGTDFIQKYIFPGGFLPSDTAFATEVKRAGLSIRKVSHFGESYARTLAEWRARFEAQWHEISALGFDERFHRLWTYYLCYCEAGFEEGAINVGLYAIEHAGG